MTKGITFRIGESETLFPIASPDGIPIRLRVKCGCGEWRTVTEIAFCAASPAPNQSDGVFDIKIEGNCSECAWHNGAGAE